MQWRRHEFSPWVGNIPWRREWLPSPVFFPTEFHGQRSLVGYSPWGSKESDMTGFRKGRGSRNQIANISWIIGKKKTVPENYLLLLYWLCQSLWLCGPQQTLENSERDAWPASWEICMQVRNQQLELDMEQQTGSK